MVVYVQGRQVFKSRWLSPYTLAPHFFDGSRTFGAIGRVHIGPIQVPRDCIIDAIVYEVGAVVAGNARIGLYTEGATQDRPDGGTLVIESGSMAQPAGGYGCSIFEFTPIFLKAGQYFVAIQGDDATGTFMGLRNLNFNVFNPGTRYYDHGYGAFTNPCPVTTATAGVPCVTLRVVRFLN